MPSGEKFIEIPFPVGGLEEYSAVEHGSPLGGYQKTPTTQSAHNVCGIDPRSGRVRGGTRSGISKYLYRQANADTNIQEIASVASAAVDSLSGAGQIFVPKSTDDGDSTGMLISTNGDALSQEISTGQDSDVILMSCFGRSGELFTAYRRGTTLRVKNTALNGRTTWDVAGPTVKLTTYVGGICADSNYVYVYTEIDGVNQCELGRWNLATSGTYSQFKSVAAGTLGTYAPTISPGPYASLASVNNGTVGTLCLTSGTPNLYRHATALAASTAPSITQVGVTGTATSANSLTSRTDGAFFVTWGATAGPYAMNAVGTNGSAILSATAPNTTSGALIVSCTGHDSLPQTIWALKFGSTNAANIVGTSAGSIAFTSNYPTNSETWDRIAATPEGGFVVSKDANDYAGGAKLLMGSPTASTLRWVGLYEDVNYTQLAVNYANVNNVSFTRSVVNIVVSAGNVRKFTRYSLVDPTNPSSLSPSYPVIFSASLGGDLFFADGSQPRYYNSSTNTVSDWDANVTAGDYPIDENSFYPRLICQHRGRIWLAEKSNWYASKIADAFDWDYSPARQTIDQAAAGTVLNDQNSAGASSDIITALIPFNDDVLFFGGDRTVKQMTGDPMDGGRIDTVSDETGVAWGRAFCRMPDGGLLFFGSRGGVFIISPNSAPRRLTAGSIDYRLSNVNLRTHIVRMAWNDKEQGAMLYITPYDVTQSTTHYFWDSRNNAWWPFSYSDPFHNPKAVCTIDGDDPDDRALVIGSATGYLRFIDRDADDDDGEDIPSYVYIGPISNTLLKELQFTLSNSSTATLDWTTHSGNFAEEAIAASSGASGSVTSGRTHSFHPRRSGGAIYLKLSSDSGIWNLEKLMAVLQQYTQGRARRF